MWLFLTVLWVGLRCVIVVIPGHTHLLFLVHLYFLTSQKVYFSRYMVRMVRLKPYFSLIDCPCDMQLHPSVRQFILGRQVGHFICCKFETLPQVWDQFIVPGVRIKKIVSMIRNTTITNCRQTLGSPSKSHIPIKRHQEDKQSEATSSLLPIKMIAKLEWTQSNSR